MLVISAAGVALLAPGRRTLWAGGLLYLVVLVGRVRRAVAVRAERAAARRARRPVACSCSRTASACRCSRWRSSASGCSTCSGCRPCAPSPRRTAIPSTRLAFQAEARDFLAQRGQARRARRGADDRQPLGGRRPGQGRPARARLGAPARPEGQPDLLRRRAADRRRATTTGCARTRSAGSRCRTRRWTTPRATRRSCSSAGRSSSSSPTSRRAGGSGRCAGTDPPASGGAKLLAAGPNWFMVDAERTTVVRYRYTKYWSTSDACLSRAPGGWTEVEPASTAASCSSRRKLRPGARPAAQRGVSPRGADARRRS